jgi:hypothetical protein
VIRTHIYESYQAYMAASGAGRALSDQGGQF